MTKKTVSTAWDDDWEAQADKAASEDKETGGAPLNAESAVLSRAERLAKHKEEQRRLWKSAYVVAPPPSISPLLTSAGSAS